MATRFRRLRTRRMKRKALKTRKMRGGAGIFNTLKRLVPGRSTSPVSSTAPPTQRNKGVRYNPTQDVTALLLQKESEKLKKQIEAMGIPPPMQNSFTPREYRNALQTLKKDLEETRALEKEIYNLGMEVDKNPDDSVQKYKNILGKIRNILQETKNLKAQLNAKGRVIPEYNDLNIEQYRNALKEMVARYQ